MSGLDQDALARIRDWAQKQIDQEDRRKRMEPLFEAVMGDGRALATSGIPDLMAGPTAQSRQAILNMEKRLAESEAKQSEADIVRERNLAGVRRRTDALRSWLEALA